MMAGKRERQTDQLLPIGGSKKMRIGNARPSQGGIGPHDFGIVEAVRMTDHPRMREAMIADFVSAGEDLPDQIFMRHDRITDQKESRMRAMTAQNVERPGRGVGCRTIIQGKRDHGLTGIDMADRFADQHKTAGAADVEERDSEPQHGNRGD